MSLYRKLALLVERDHRAASHLRPLLEKYASHGGFTKALEEALPKDSLYQEAADTLVEKIFIRFEDRLAVLWDKVSSSSKGRGYDARGQSHLEKHHTIEGWGVAFEATYPPKVVWSVQGTVNFSGALHWAVKQTASRHRLDEKVLLAALKAPPMRKHAEALWARVVLEHRDRDLPGHWKGSKPIQTMVDWWSDRVDVDVDWDDDAPFQELAEPYDVVDAWDVHVDVAPTRTGVSYLYQASVKVDIKVGR